MVCSVVSIEAGWCNVEVVEVRSDIAQGAVSDQEGQENCIVEVDVATDRRFRSIEAATVVVGNLPGEQGVVHDCIEIR